MVIYNATWRRRGIREIGYFVFQENNEDNNIEIEEEIGIEIEEKINCEIGNLQNDLENKEIRGEVNIENSHNFFHEV